MLLVLKAFRLHWKVKERTGQCVGDLIRTKYLGYNAKGEREERSGSKATSVCVVPVCGCTFS